MDVPSVMRSGARFKTDSVCCDAQKVLQDEKRGFLLLEALKIP